MKNMHDCTQYTLAGQQQQLENGSHAPIYVVQLELVNQSMTFPKNCFHTPLVYTDKLAFLNKLCFVMISCLLVSVVE